MYTIQDFISELSKQTGLDYVQQRASGERYVYKVSSPTGTYLYDITIFCTRPEKRSNNPGLGTFQIGGCEYKWNFLKTSENVNNVLTK